jgi:group I intron endonuclease
MNSIIYKIVNKNDEEIIYVGRTKNLKKRWAEHRSEYRNENRPCYNFKLYKEIRDKGLENFEILPIEINTCKDREGYWYDELKPNFNMRKPCGSGNSSNINLTIF